MLYLCGSSRNPETSCTRFSNRTCLRDCALKKDELLAVARQSATEARLEELSASVTAIDVTITELLPDHTADVFQLYERIMLSLPHGFLAERSVVEFQQILSVPETSASVGAWRDGQLVAYVLYSARSGRMEHDSPVLSQLWKSGEPWLVSRGAGVDPEFRDMGIMAHLVEARKALSKSKGFDHATFLIARQNLVSLYAALRSGSWLVGFEHDEYCLNYLCYSGRFCDEVPLSSEANISLDDIDSLRKHTSDGWVGISLDRKNDSVADSVTLKKAGRFL